MNARRFIGDVLLAASGLLILMFALVLVDDRFREHGPIAAASVPGEHVTDLALATALLVAQFARQQMIEHTHLTVFAGVAFLLALTLLRL